MKEWFGKLQQREQQFILAGSTALGMFLVYALLWSPFSSSIELLHQRVVSQEKTLQWMKTSAEEIRLQDSALPVLPAGKRSLLTLVSQTSKTAGLGPNMKRVEEDGRSKTRVWLEQVDFDKLILWLGSLQTQYGITPSLVTIEHLATKGVVNARLVLNK